MINRDTLQAALAVHENLISTKKELPIPTLPNFSWQQCVRLQSKIDQAKQHGWQRAVKLLRTHLVQAANSCCRELEKVSSQLENEKLPGTSTTAHDIYHDLIALESEFDSVEFDFDCKVIRVETDSIVLEKVNLGCFQIVLDWTQLGEPKPYKTIAMDEDLVSQENEFTHPHVQDNRLCEGEGQVPIAKALSQGRLFDFFILIRQVLETYNPASAYRMLCDWDGVLCTDCDSIMQEDERGSCERCDVELCNECSYSCEECGCYCCSSCGTSCQVCHESLCIDCNQICSQCNQSICKECQTNEKCKTCHKKEQEEESSKPSESESITAQGANTKVHPVCLGETAVPA